MRGRSGVPDFSNLTHLPSKGKTVLMEERESPLKWECLGEREGSLFFHIGGTELTLSILHFELDMKELYEVGFLLMCQITNDS